MPQIAIPLNSFSIFFSTDLLKPIRESFAFNINWTSESFTILLLLVSFIFGFVLSGIISYFFLMKIKKQYNSRINQKIKQVKKDTAIRTAQSFTSVFIQEISSYNNQIKEWMHYKLNKGEQIPRKVEQANQNISQSLVNLSRLSFEFPYMQSVYKRADSVKKITHQS